MLQHRSCSHPQQNWLGVAALEFELRLIHRVDTDNRVKFTLRRIIDELNNSVLILDLLGYIDLMDSIVLMTRRSRSNDDDYV